MLQNSSNQKQIVNQKYMVSKETKQKAADSLNEVLLSLFSKDFEFLAKLYSTRRNGYTDLDFYILQSLKLNVYSPTSPYRNKFKPIPNAEVDYIKLRIIDEPYDEIDTPAIILKQFKLVRHIFERLELTELERKVYSKSIAAVSCSVVQNQCYKQH